MTKNFRIVLTLGLFAAVISVMPAAYGHVVQVNPVRLMYQLDASVEAIELETPRRIAYQPMHETRVRTQLVAFDRHAMVVLDEEGQRQRVLWLDVQPRSVKEVLENVIDRQNAAHWMEAGLILQWFEIMQEESERMLARALHLDANLQDTITQAREENLAAIDAWQQAETQAENNAGQEGGVNGPVQIGDGPGNTWPVWTEEQHTAFIETADNHYHNVLDQMGVRYETDSSRNFLLMTNIPNEGTRTLELLERMYEELTDVFALEEEDRVFAGKCVVVLLANKQQYDQFNNLAYGRTLGGSLGVCWQFGNGLVQIAAYRDRDENSYLHTLVHENVHGFLFRYRSPVHIPNWANEGLADWLAELFVNAGISNRKQTYANRLLRDGQALGNYYEMPNIDAWMYGLAYGMTDMMMQGNRTGYRDFIHAIKDGDAWRDALEENLNVTPEQLTNVYFDEHSIVRR